ncbi:ADP-dependent glucokinase [Actinidia chinensis var. chinensis]|uniref:ADP-dependent glucokinase n=1 Tax=Actinidia chinensis var. chinensis TaxID=1590841 RepID=A0A2R6PBL6_ACTCC|nr:ADP-dependent glucokinase [Actinidia chinensis var. chinensis]
MGTKVHGKSYLPGYYSMRDLNEDSGSSNWPLFYGDRTLANGQYCNGFLPRTVTNAYSGYEKHALKQTMLEHEAIFKHQVFELHRLYKIQKDMMDEISRKELYKHPIPIDTPSSSSRLVSQMPYEDARNWQKSTVALNSACARLSFSGAEIISPLSCREGNGKQAGRIPFQNGFGSKDCEILECRPSKVRKKFFDLQLPADEHIDTEEGEQSLDNKISDISSYPPRTDHKTTLDCNGDASRSPSFLADLNEPVQIEEATLPASVDFLGRSAGHGEIKELDLAAKTKSQFLLDLPMEVLHISQHGSNNGTPINLHIENKGNRREWSSYSCDAGRGKTHLMNSIPQGLQPDKSLMSSQLQHTMLNKAHQPLGALLSDHSRRDFWRERTIRGPELSEKSRDISSFNHLEPVVASHIPSPYPLLHSSNLDNAWSHSVSTWGKPSSSLTQKLTSIHTHPSLNPLGSLSKSSPSSGQNHEIFGDKWDLHSSSGSKPGFGSGLPNCNGFYHGSASGLKDLPTRFPSVGFDYLNCNKDDKVASERSINYGPRSYLNSSSVLDMSPKDMKLNKILAKCSSNEVVPQHGPVIIDEERKCEDHLKVLPWLKAKPACKNEGTSTKRDSNSSEISFLQAASNQLSGKSETVKGPNQLFAQNITLASCDREVGAKRNEVGDSLVNQKIPGFPIFSNHGPPKNESSSLVSTSASLRCTQAEDIKKESKTGVIDINLACDPECGTEIAAEVVVIEKEKEKVAANFRAHIDLNSCVTDEEVTLAPSVASKSIKVKIAVEIDLEALPETEEDIPPAEEQPCEMPLISPLDQAEQPLDEVARIAAEAIVAISSCNHLNHMEETTCHLFEATLPNSLLWFVEIVSSCEDGVERTFGTESKGKAGGVNRISSSGEIDYFEAMTLNLPEVTEEEYMPKPSVPDKHKVEETGTTSLPNRPRRGQARRGRQRRDFQRDILPGLASLSRHEVTEDLQTFGGLMRATGYSWQSGLTRRNGIRNGSAARGRRRLLVEPAPVVAATTVCTPLMQQLNNIEVGLEDRTLTGWGKTPRRPRRQRCPAGNPPSIPLTS